jgi:hypothetical protein
MSTTYRFDAADQRVLAAIEQLVRRLISSGRLRPGQLVSVAKILHVLVNLPRVTEDVFVTVSISQRITQEGCGGTSGWQFSVSGDELTLDCGGSEYTEGVGSDSFTTMWWWARPGQSTDYDGSWDSAWMHDDYSGGSVSAEDFSDCEVSVEDDDNPLLFEPDEDDCDVKEDESDSNTSSEPRT